MAKAAIFRPKARRGARAPRGTMTTCGCATGAAPWGTSFHARRSELSAHPNLQRNRLRAVALDIEPEVYEAEELHGSDLGKRFRRPPVAVGGGGAEPLGNSQLHRRPWGRAPGLRLAKSRSQRHRAGPSRREDLDAS